MRKLPILLTVLFAGCSLLGPTDILPSGQDTSEQPMDVPASEYRPGDYLGHVALSIHGSEVPYVEEEKSDWVRLRKAELDTRLRDGRWVLYRLTFYAVKTTGRRESQKYRLYKELRWNVVVENDTTKIMATVDGREVFYGRLEVRQQDPEQLVEFRRWLERVDMDTLKHEIALAPG